MNLKIKSSISAENFKTQISRITSAFLERLLDIYLISFGLKSFLNLVLQCAYVHSQRFSSDQKWNGESDSQYFVNEVRDLMLIIGQQYREIGTTGVCYYSIRFYSWVLFYVIEKVSTRNWLNYISNGGLLAFVENPIREEEIIKRRTNLLIQKLIESNIYFTRIILGQESIINIRRLNQKVFNHRKTFKKAQPTSVAHCNETSNSTSTSHCMAREVSIYSLTSQLKHLNKLESNSSKLWPPNRVSTWRDHIKRMWLKLYLASYVGVWFTCTTCVSYALHFARKTLTESSLDKIYTKFSLPDRLSSVDLVIYCWIVAGWFAFPSTAAIMSVYDQFKFANSFEPRLSILRSRIENLAQLCEHRNRSSLSIQDIYIEKLIRYLKIECDNECVEFYISFRLFREDLKTTLKTTQENVGKSVSMIFLTLLTSLIFYNRVKIDQIPVLICITMISMISLDCAFILCAALHASSCRITNLVWPLITSAESCNLKSFLAQPFGIADTPIVRVPVNISGVPNDQSDSPAKFIDINFDFEYYSHSLISPHTIFLLRKIAANHVFLARSSVCRLYGSIPLDYRGIMKINFWLMSSVLLALTYYN